MSWKNILKSFEKFPQHVFNDLREMINKKYKGDEAIRRNFYGDWDNETVALFFKVSGELDNIAKSFFEDSNNTIEEDLIEFMIQYLDFNYASAKKFMDSRK